MARRIVNPLFDEVNIMPDEPVPDTLEDALREIDRLRRSLASSERNNLLLAKLSDTAERERQSLESERKLQYLYNDLLLENCPNMIMLFDEQLRYVIASDASRTLTGGKDDADLLHKPFNEVFADKVDPQWVEKARAQNWEVVAAWMRWRYDDVIRLAGEEVMNVQVEISPIVDSEGVCRGSLMAITDISELVRTKRRAEDAALAKSVFLANMSHEIRTPMNAVKGLSELLSLTELTDLQRSYVHTIVDSAGSLLGVINDVLDFSKIDANRVEIAMEKYSLSRLLSEIAGPIGIRAAEKGLGFFVDADPVVPVSLIGDAVHIKQILVNLLANAVKYTPAGLVRLVVKAECRDGSVYFIFRVEDTGIGIKEQDIPSLFNIFSRVDLHTNKGIMGTGLGLAISHRLAEAMGGHIAVESEYGKGSVFQLEIPQKLESKQPLAEVRFPAKYTVLLLGSGPRLDNVARMLGKLNVRSAALDVGPDAAGEQDFSHVIYAENAPDELVEAWREKLSKVKFAALVTPKSAADNRSSDDIMLMAPLLVSKLARFINRGDSSKTGSSLRPGDPADLFRVRGVTALVVDDNRVNLLVCERMLQLYGADVVTAIGGEEALVLCASRRFDVAFLDHMMPGMDGIELARRLRSEYGPNQKTPLIALTANVVNDVKSLYLESGMDDFIGKPIDRHELCRVLYEYLPKEKIASRVSVG